MARALDLCPLCPCGNPSLPTPSEKPSEYVVMVIVWWEKVGGDLHHSKKNDDEISNYGGQFGI